MRYNWLVSFLHSHWDLYYKHKLPKYHHICGVLGTGFSVLYSYQSVPYLPMYNLPYLNFLMCSSYLNVRENPESGMFLSSNSVYWDNTAWLRSLPLGLAIVRLCYQLSFLFLDSDSNGQDWVKLLRCLIYYT